MNPKIIIRKEIDADVGAISEVTAAAFMTLEISNHTEQFIIEALRAAKALTVSLVAEMNGRVIGHIADGEQSPGEKHGGDRALRQATSLMGMRSGPRSFLEPD